MINLQDLHNPFMNWRSNTAIRQFIAWIIIDRWLLKNNKKLFYNEQDKITYDNYRVIDDKMFLNYKPKAYKVFQLAPDWWIIKEFFDNRPFQMELPVCTSPNAKILRKDMLLKYFIWPLAKEKIIDDLLFTILKSLVWVIWIYIDYETLEIWFFNWPTKDWKALISKKWVNFRVKDVSLEEVLWAEIEQGFINKTVWDENRDYAYTHLLREHAKFKLFNWSKNVLINWRKINVLATSRSQWKTFFWAFIGARGLLDTRPWFGWRHYREIKIFVPNKEDIWNQYMTYIKSMIWDMRHIKLENWSKAFEIGTWSIKCNITWNVLKIISLNNIANEWKWELWTARWEWLACDLAIVDEAARISNEFWTSFYQRAAFETQEFYLTSTINKETPVDHWFYKLLIDWECWDEDISSYRIDIEHNEAMMMWKTKEEFKKQIETVKKILREWGDKEFYSKWYCMILEESNVFNVSGNIVKSNASKYLDTDVRILWFDLWKLDDSAALILLNLTHKEIESSVPIYNATYWTQLQYAKEYKIKYPNIYIIWDRSWVWEAVAEQDTEWIVDVWIKSTGQWWLNHNKKMGYYTCSKWTMITTLAWVFNTNTIRIPSHNELLIEQLKNFVKMKSWRWEVILYQGKNKTKDDLVLATAYAVAYMYLILWLKDEKEITNYVTSIWNSYSYSYNDADSSNGSYYNSYY